MLQFTIEPISSVKEQVGFLLILLVLLTITILMIIPSSHGLPLESCESSSGYITLPGNLLLQWKKMTNVGNWNGGDYDPTTCTFPVSFSTTPYYCDVTIINPTVTRDNYFYGYLYDGTKATQHSGIAMSKSYCVFTAHKDFTGALIIAIGKA